MEDDFLQGLEENPAPAVEETEDGAEDGADGQEAADGAETAGAEGETAASPAAAPPSPGQGPAPVLTPEAAWLIEQANARGLSVPALIEQMQRDSRAVRESERQQRVSRLADMLLVDLQAKYAYSAEDGLLRAHASELAEKTLRGQEEAAERDRIEREQYARAEQEKAEQAMRAPWVRYFAKYPEADAEKLPVELLLKVRGGLSPVEAQLEIELEQAKTGAGREATRQANQEKAVGSLKGPGAREPADPFLEGLRSKD